MAVEKIEITEIVTEDAQPTVAPHILSAKEGKKDLKVKFIASGYSGTIRAWRLRVGTNRNSGYVFHRLGMVCGSGDRAGPNTRSLDGPSTMIVEWTNPFGFSITVTVKAFVMVEGSAVPPETPVNRWIEE